MLAMRVLAEGGEGGPNVVMWVLVFLAIFALMVLIGWWASASGKVKQEEELVHSDHGHDSHAAHDKLPAASSHAVHHAEAASPAEAAPVMLADETPVSFSLEAAEPASAQPDNLVSLEGIGPKVAKLLNDNGISTFAQLAGADLGKLRQVLDAAGYKYMEPAGWVEQAKLAAAGDAEGLKKLQDGLKGGRKAG